MHLERVNVTELNPMVHNPIYEGAAIYEEIPGDITNFRSLPHLPTDNTKDTMPALTCKEKEEGYVSMSTSGISSSWDFPTPEKCQQVKIGR